MNDDDDDRLNDDDDSLNDDYTNDSLNDDDNNDSLNDSMNGDDDNDNQNNVALLTAPHSRQQSSLRSFMMWHTARWDPV
jgi:hypothetical protein